MKTDNDIKEMHDHMNQRMDQLEKLLTLLLLSNTIEEYTKNTDVEICDDVVKAFEDNDYSIIKSELFGDKIAVYIKPLNKVGLKKIRTLKNRMNAMYKNLVLVFVMDKLSISQRRKFLEEKISFLIEDKELYIVK